MNKINEDMIRREADAPATSLAAVYAARTAAAAERELGDRENAQARMISRENIREANLELGTMTGALQIIANHAEAWGWDMRQAAEYAADVLARAAGEGK